MYHNKKSELNEMSLEPSQLLLLGGVIFAVMHFLWRLMSIISYAKNRDKVHAENYTLDKEWTKKLREITKNEKLMIRIDNDEASRNEINVFTPGANTIVYNGPVTSVFTENEIIALFLHEYGHISEKHANKFFKFDMAYTFALHSIVLSIGIFGTPFLMLIIWATEYILGARDVAHDMYNLSTSKRHEFVADSYANKYGYGKALISVFKKFEVLEKKQICKNLSNRRCNRLIKSIYRWAEYPTNEQRIKRLIRLIARNQLYIKQKFSSKDVRKVENTLSKFAKTDKMDKILGDEQ